MSDVYALTEDQLGAIVGAIQEAVRIPQDVNRREQPKRDTTNDCSNACNLIPTADPSVGVDGPVLKAAPGNPRGVTTIYVTTSYKRPTTIETAPSQKVVLHVDWGFGHSGGKADVDITQGGVFTIVGAEAVNAVAEIVAVGDVTGLNFLVPVRVEAMVGRDGAVSPKAAYGTGVMFELAAHATTTAKTLIPERASHMMLLLSEPSRAADVTVEFYGSNHADAELLYAMSAPTNGMVPIVAGARYFKLEIVDGGALNATPVFDLWL